MEPIQLGALTIYPFGLFFAILLIPFFGWISARMRKSGMKEETASWFAVLAVPLCFVLSRLGFCILNADIIFGYGDPGMAFRPWEGGFLLWGAAGGILLAAWAAGKITKQSGAAIADAAVVPMCLMIAAVRLLSGLLFDNVGIGCNLAQWFDPEETDMAYRLSLWPLEDWSFFERFPFAKQNYYGVWCWAVYVLQALWAAVTAWLVRRPEAAQGGRTARFIILFSCGSIVLESMLYGGEVYRIPWLAFVKANQILCAVALLCTAIACLRRLEKGSRMKAAVILFAQFLAAVGLIIVLEFTAFEKKIAAIEWLTADACHLLMTGLCVWMALAFRSVWKKAYGAAPSKKAA